MGPDAVPEFHGYRLDALVAGGRPSDAGPGDAEHGASDDPRDRPRVWRATRLADDRSVAIKVFPAARAGLARREAALLSAVDHPHLLALLDVVGTAEHVGLVTPFAAGGSLAALLVRRGRLTWPETLTVLIPLADALAAADERELVHGDLSAGNVLFDAAGRPLLADLGAARAAAEWSQPVAVTPTDVAPEVARGSPPDHRSDLFSLGSIALHCLSGHPAWPAETVTDALIQSTLGQWPDPEFVIAPDDLLALVRRLLDPEPGRRGSAAALAVDLRRVGEPAPVDLSERTADGRPRLPATQIRPEAPALRVATGTRRRRAGWRRRRTGGEIRDGSGVGRDAKGVGRQAKGVGRDAKGIGRHAAGRGVGSRTVGQGTDGRRQGPPRRPVPRIRNAVIGVLAVLAMGAGAVRVGLWWAGSGQVDPPTVGSIPATSPHGAATTASGAVSDLSAGSSPPGGWDPTSQVDWTTVVAGLDADRARALTEQDPALLDLVYAPGATELAMDVATIQRLRTAGYRLAAAAHDISSVVVLPDGYGSPPKAESGDSISSDPSTDPHATAVRVVEAMPQVTILGADGQVLGHTEAAAGSAVVLYLVKTDDGFRISSIEPG